MNSLKTMLFLCGIFLGLYLVGVALTCLLTDYGFIWLLGYTITRWLNFASQWGVVVFLLPLATVIGITLYRWISDPIVNQMKKAKHDSLLAINKERLAVRKERLEMKREIQLRAEARAKDLQSHHVAKNKKATEILTKRQRELAVREFELELREKKAAAYQHNAYTAQQSAERWRKRYERKCLEINHAVIVLTKEGNTQYALKILTKGKKRRQA